MLAWFTSEQGVLVCAPTGTGKTLIAEAAMFEALQTGKRAYYTTPLIALTDQKFHDLQEAAVRWGFRAEDVGLVTGNRRVNPDANVLVVVAEILFNRLLHRGSDDAEPGTAFAFDDVSAVVMDEFHSFNDPERGIVWEFSLSLLPAHIRLLLLSATVGNSVEFIMWLQRCHERRLELVQSDDRKVPLTFQWQPDSLLNEHVESMFVGSEAERKTPALIFCFNRDECWNVAEQLKGKKLVGEEQRRQLMERLDDYDWSAGAGPKLKQILTRGIGVHHAGVLPKYRRIVEQLFQEKLLSIAVCTETLAAGINLPARSVVLPSLLKGPRDKKKLIDPSAANQMFGRAGRPQYDSQGYVFALAHEDDVKISRWRVKYDAIPDDTKDPGLRKAKKALKKKMPTRRSTQQYWTEQQFDKLVAAAPRKLASRGGLPWRFLVHLLEASPDVQRIRQLIGQRLLDSGEIARGQKALDRMLLTLWRAGYVTLEPHPPLHGEQDEPAPVEADDAEPYRPLVAQATPALDRLLIFRGVHPLYGVFLLNQLGIADRAERLQAMESVLEMPGSVARHVRVPSQQDLPPGPLATERLDTRLLQLGLVSAAELTASPADEEPEPRKMFEEEKPRVLNLAEKLRLLFDYDFPGVHDVWTRDVWVAGELLEFGGDFNKYVTSRNLQKQEGVIFRHLLRLILLIAEFQQLTPPETTDDEWLEDLGDISRRLAECCRVVDPYSTDKALEEIQDGRQ